MNMQIEWSYPTTVRVGQGAARRLAHACRDAGIKRPLIVTDKGISDSAMVREALAECGSKLETCGLFDEVKGNPTEGNVAAGVAVFREGGHDGVIAFGGGSPIDAGKAIAFVAGQKFPLWDYEDTNPDRGSKIDPAAIAPTIALPTTAGTGSEVGRASVITDEVARVKRTIMHPTMMPRIAILDPDLTADLPPHLAAATGADALTHCLESLCSTGYHPMSEIVAMDGARIIGENLVKAVSDRSDVAARQAMLVASAMGAVGFQRGLGGVHAIAQSLGAVYDKHHGLLNAILMPYVMKANEEAIGPSCAILARHLQLPKSTTAAVLDWVLHLREAVGIPNDLAAIGISDDEAELIGRMSFCDGCSNTNPVPHSAKRYAEIFRDAVRGRL
jgi:alcohol dehydrogenase class IV